MNYSRFFHAWRQPVFYHLLSVSCVLLMLLMSSSRMYGQIQVYTDRAAWEAALSAVVNEDLESATEDFSLANSFNMNPGASITVGTHTFTGTISGDATALGLDVPPLEGHSLFPNSNQISWWGTTGGSPNTTVSIPTAFGIGFDWKSAATSFGLHNSIYLQATGNSGSFYQLLNPNPPTGPAGGFIGIISPCGGINSYTVFSTWTNWQGFSIDNFAYGTISSLPDSDNDGTVDCDDGCPNDPNKIAPGGCGCGVADTDGDGDGSPACNDCNDANPLVYPGSVENLTNGVDDNCDGLVDIPAYCTPGLSYPCYYMWITNVTLDNINNTTSCSSGSSAYPSASTALTPGANHTISVSSGGGYGQFFSVFIDWNQDGDFEDTDEKVVSDIYLPDDGTPASATFSVPATQGGGTYLMRVVSDYAYYIPEPCYSAYGEIEDYLVTIDACDDADGDGYEDAACGGDDCADNDNTVYPGALDICDGKDNDCDGSADEGGNTPSSGWSAGNIGGATNTGSSFACNSGSSSGTVFTVASQGFSGAANADLINSNYQQRCGDASITVHISSNPAPGWAGIYIRESLASGSKMVGLKTNLSSFLRRETRTTVNGNKTTSQNPLYAGNTWLRIVRTGNAFAFYTSSNGTTWTFFGSSTVVMSSCVYLGVFAESINATTTVNASFDNITITGGAAPLVAAPGNEFVIREQQTMDVTVYPNPSSGALNLRIATPGVYGQSVQVRVLNTLGAQIWANQLENIGSVEALSSLPELPDGVYWIQVQAPDFTPVTSRVVIQR